MKWLHALMMLQSGPLMGACVLATAAALGWVARRAAVRLAAADDGAPPGAVAMVGAAMAMAAVALCGELRLSSAPGVALGWGLLTLAAVDAATQRLPNALTLPLIGLGLVAAVWGRTSRPFDTGVLLDHGVGAIVGYASFAGVAVAYRRIRGRDGLGLGDAKLAAAAGAWLGALALPLTVLIACALAFGWVGARWLRRGRAVLLEPLPFGPPLAAAIWLVWCLPGLANGPP
jgi:leader peptidase (prepilin peptidase)/N-methyltransferase